MLEVRHVRQKANLSEQGSSAAKAKRRVSSGSNVYGHGRIIKMLFHLCGENLCS